MSLAKRGRRKLATDGAKLSTTAFTDVTSERSIEKLNSEHAEEAGDNSYEKRTYRRHDVTSGGNCDKSGRTLYLPAADRRKTASYLSRA